MSTPEWKEFLRARKPDGLGFIFAGVGWLVFYPLVLWLGQVNEAIPLPEGIQNWEAQQGDAMEMLLLGANLPTWFLFIAVAITPAICEELMFRGYLQRQVERGGGGLIRFFFRRYRIIARMLGRKEAYEAWIERTADWFVQRKSGLIGSIVLVGIVFGLYHLQLSKALPLAALGMYLGFVVWATGSVWTGALVHLLNNGFAVMAVAYARSQPDLDLEAIETMGIPGYLVAVSLALTAGVCYLLFQRRRQLVGETPDAAPTEVAPVPLDTSPLSSASPAHV